MNCGFITNEMQIYKRTNLFISGKSEEKKNVYNRTISMHLDSAIYGRRLRLLFVYEIFEENDNGKP